MGDQVKPFSPNIDPLTDTSMVVVNGIERVGTSTNGNPTWRIRLDPRWHPRTGWLLTEQDGSIGYALRTDGPEFIGPMVVHHTKHRKPYMRPRVWRIHSTHETCFTCEAKEAQR